MTPKEKREPAFGKDHAQTNSATMTAIQFDRIVVYPLIRSLGRKVRA
jgi:hypothetical protein